MHHLTGPVPPPLPFAPGRIFCQDCSSRRVGPHRICDLCVDASFPDDKGGSSGLASPAPTRPTNMPRMLSHDANSMGRASTDGDEGDEGEPMVVRGANDRVAKLERRVAQLQAQLLAASRTHVPTPLDMVSHSELAVGLMYPVLAIIAGLGWRMVPLTIATFAVWLWLSGYGITMWAPLLGIVGWMVHVARSPKFGLFRRRMRVYGIAFSAFCDYKVRHPPPAHTHVSSAACMMRRSLRP